MRPSENSVRALVHKSVFNLEFYRFLCATGWASSVRLFLERRALFVFFVSALELTYFAGRIWQEFGPAFCASTTSRTVRGGDGCCCSCTERALPAALAVVLAAVVVVATTSQPDDHRRRRACQVNGLRRAPPNCSKSSITQRTFLPVKMAVAANWPMASSPLTCVPRCMILLAILNS